MYRFFYIILIVFLYFSFILTSYSRDLIIVGIPEEPNRWIDNSGKTVGIDIDIIDYIMNKLGVKYKVILEDSSARIQAINKNSTPPFDMIFTYSKNKEREKYLIYPQESHIDFSWNFFIRKEDLGKYKFNSMEDLKGLTIGATKEFSYTPEFWKAGNEGLFKLDIIVKNNLQISKLLNKRFDMVPMNTLITYYELKKSGIISKVDFLPTPLKKSSYYNVFVKKSDYPNLEELVKKYDEVLKEMKEDGTLKAILSKYGF